MHIADLPAICACRPASKKGGFVGQKRPLLPKHVAVIRVRLEIAKNVHDLALVTSRLTANGGAVTS